MFNDLVWRENCKHEMGKPKMNDNHNSSEQTLSSCEVSEQEIENKMTLNNIEGKSEQHKEALVTL